jgi:hypothetical protein
MARLSPSESVEGFRMNPTRCPLRIFILALPILLAFPVPVPAGEPAADPAAEATPELTAEIVQRVRELGSEQWAVREKAEERLKAIGRPAVPELRKAIATEDEEVRARAERILFFLERAPSDADLLRLASDLEAVVRNPNLDDAPPTGPRKPTLEEAVLGGIAKRVAEFRDRHAPKKGSATYASRDGKTVVVCLGAPATAADKGASAEARGETRWVVAAGGQGLDVLLPGLPSGGEAMPSGEPGAALAEASRGIAVAVAGDGLLLRVPGGIAGGGRGADAKAVSPVCGIAWGGRDRTKSIEPPLDGDCDGRWDFKALKAFLAEPEKGK